MLDYGCKFFSGAAFAIASNMVVTTNLALRDDKHNIPVIRGPERQALPIVLGAMALIYSIKNGAEPTSLGFAVGMVLMQGARFQTGCYSTGTERCEQFDPSYWLRR